jgi:ABC-type protease/lipase transport system fused ATPase/permease subunit
MVWLTAGNEKGNEHTKLMVRHTVAGYELLEMSERGAEVLETFARCEDAIQRWNDLEAEHLGKRRGETC